MIHEASGELLYTVRVGAGFEPPVYAPGKYTVKAGKDQADAVVFSGYDISIP